MNKHLIEHRDSRFRNILFSGNLKVQNVLLAKNSSLFSFFNILKRLSRNSLPGVLFINGVTNKPIGNTLSAFNWQYILPTNLLHLNDFLFVALKRCLVGIYKKNEKNSKVVGRNFTESSNGKLSKPYHKSSYIMSKTALGKHKKTCTNSKRKKKFHCCLCQKILRY